MTIADTDKTQSTGLDLEEKWFIGLTFLYITSVPSVALQKEVCLTRSTHRSVDFVTFYMGTSHVLLLLPYPPDTIA